jgi:hypothetical protein
MKKTVSASLIALGAVSGTSAANAQTSYYSHHSIYPVDYGQYTQTASLFGTPSSRGNYFCANGCAIGNDIYAGTLAFIRSTVNADVNRWIPGDTVTITDGETYVVVKYLANGNFVIVETGDGIGPGEPKNHDGEGGQQAGTTGTASYSGSGGYSGTTTYSPDFAAGYYGPNASYGGGGQTGTVTMTEWYAG